jgi:hypothetical protein
VGMLGFETKFGGAVLAEVKVNVHGLSLRCLSVPKSGAALMPVWCPTVPRRHMPQVAHGRVRQVA